MNGFRFLGEAYAATDPAHTGRLSVPVLWDTETKRIVNNESADVLRMYTTAFDRLATREIDLWPEPHRDGDRRAQHAAVRRRQQRRLRRRLLARPGRLRADRAHACSRRSTRWTRASETRRFLFGDAPVETDWRLFTTLLRFDAVYNIHFKCSLRRVVDYAHLWPYARDLYQWPGVAGTVRFDDIRRHYYLTHGSINPSRIVAVAPDEDWDAPHGRG